MFGAEDLRPLMLHAQGLVCTGPPMIQFAVRVAVQNSHLQYVKLKAYPPFFFWSLRIFLARRCSHRDQVGRIWHSHRCGRFGPDTVIACKKCKQVGSAI